MLRTGPWDTATILEAPNGGTGALNGRSDAPVRSLAKRAGGPSGELVGDKLTPTLGVPVLGSLSHARKPQGLAF